MSGKKINPLDFINTIRKSAPELQTKIFTHGACYQFYKILKYLFPNAEAYYDGTHVITKIGKKFYDITGEVELGRHILMEKPPTYWGETYE